MGVGVLWARLSQASQGPWAVTVPLISKLRKWRGRCLGDFLLGHGARIQTVVRLAHHQRRCHQKGPAPQAVDHMLLPVAVYNSSSTSSFFFFNWRIVALQCCVSFCWTAVRFSHTYRYISPLFWIYFSFRSSQSTEQSFPCYTACSHLLPVLYIAVYAC